MSRCNRDSEPIQHSINYILVEGDGSPSDELFGSGGDEVPDTPVVAANEEENEDFAFAVAVDVGETLDMDQIIEVENQGNTTVNGIGIQFLTQGADVGGAIEQGDVANGVFSFEEDSTTISSNNFEGEDNDAPTDFTDDLGPGDDVDIDLDVDTATSEASLIDAAGIDGTQSFDGLETTADLVDEIRIGTEDPEEGET